MPTNNTHGEQPGSYQPHTRELVNFPEPGSESIKNGYETTDVNVANVIVFLGGLFGFVLIFFVFCFGMGKLINKGLETSDGPVDKWHQPSAFVGAPKGGKREDMASTTEMQQKQLQSMTSQFPNPRLDIDDGNQATADLHAKEDLLLDHYSTVPGEQGIRIPIDRAMELIVAKGLPVNVVAPAQQLAGDETPKVPSPLTSGFARTGYELDTIEARAQKMTYGKAEASAHTDAK